MTFLSAWRLLLLVVPAVLLAVYVWRTLRRPAVAARFSSADLLASIVPRRSGWQRHLPWVGLLTAIVLGVLAFAQPAVALLVPKERATIMLTMDTSRSMEADDITPNRLAAAQAAARSFVAELPPEFQVGLVTFDARAQLAQSPTTDRQALLAAIGAIDLGAGTDTGSGLELSLDAIEAVPPDADGARPPAAIVLMSDGTPTLGTADLTPEEAVAAQAVRAKDMSVPISTIAFGTDEGVVFDGSEAVPVPSDADALRAISEVTGGQAFTAESAAELDSVYQTIGTSIGYDEELTEVSAAVAGLALLFAVLAAVAALVWAPNLS